MADLRGDTEIDSRLKIVEIDGAVRGLTEDVHDIKDVLKTMAAQLEKFGSLHALIAAIQDSANVSTRRSDERWNELLRNRRADMDDYKAWRKDTDKRCEDHASDIKSAKMTVRVVWAVFVAASAIVTAVWIHDSNAEEAVRAQQEAVRAQQEAGRVLQEARISTNVNHIRSLENETMARDQNFRPPNP